MITCRLGKIILPIAAALMMVSCSQSEDSSLTVSLSGTEQEQEVKIYRQDFDKLVHIQSQKFSPNGKALTFKLGALVEPTFYQLHVVGGGQNVAVLVVEPEEKVAVSIDMKDFNNYTVEGSKESALAQTLTLELAKTIRSLDSLSAAISTAPAATEKARVKEQLQQVMDKYRLFSSSFILQNAMSRASVMALYQKFSPDRFVFDRSEDIHLFKVVGTSLLARYPESNYTKGIVRDIKNMEKLVASHKLKELVKDATMSIPEIALPNPKGDTIRLTSLKGKVVLLDFWASVNQENLLENRELLNIYKQYKSRGFEIYQVSLDFERELWVGAIESAGLPWINVSELNPNGSRVIGLYNVTRIPANYLISRDMEIIGKNLFGKDLEKKLKEVL